MKPYGRHKPFKGCYCEQCRPNTKSIKKTARQKAKKEIRDEASKMGKKSDMQDRDS